jgi:outer membrane protein OmpA-like peptidoglycan-associated protein
MAVTLLAGCAGAPPSAPPPLEPEQPRSDPPVSTLTVIRAPEDIDTRTHALAEGDQAIDPQAVGYFMDVFRARVQRDLADTGIDVDPGETSVLVTFPSQIGFEFGSAELTAEAARLIERLAAILREYKATLIVISGHTDNVGDSNFNLDLSEARARSVAEYLAQSGIAYQRLMIKGFGSAQPVADNSTEAGRASNRRVELMLRLIVRRTASGLAASETA